MWGCGGDCSEHQEELKALQWESERVRDSLRWAGRLSVAEWALFEGRARILCSLNWPQDIVFSRNPNLRPIMCPVDSQFSIIIRHKDQSMTGTPRVQKIWTWTFWYLQFLLQARVNWLLFPSGHLLVGVQMRRTKNERERRQEESHTHKICCLCYSL